MNIQWLKLSVNILDDEKIKLIRKYPDGDRVIILWLGLICLGMKSDEPGIIKIADGLPYSNEDLSAIFDLPLKTVELGITLFMKFGMIQATEGGLMEIVNFRKHQSIDELEYQRERNRQKVAKYRAKQKLLAENDVTVTCNPVTDRIEENRIEKNRVDKKRFKKPTKDQLLVYAKEINFQLDADYFLDHYEANGWKRGKTPISDWKACVRTWKKNNEKPKTNAAGDLGGNY